MRNRSGFTLIELLVVIALTILLFALLFAPMFASFNLNRQARVRIEAQDAARINLERVSREIADAMFVYDNSALIAAPGPAGTPAANAAIAYAKIDIVLPRMMMHCNDRLGHPDYERDTSAPNWPGEEAWPVCPVDQSENVTARPMQPLMPSRRVVRYFIGLLHPDQPYSNSFEDPSTPPGQDNTYVLYRAEFSPWDTNLVPRRQDGQPDMNDADFFYDQALSANWKRISRIVGPATNVNLVKFIKNDAGVYTGEAVSTVRFTPTAIENEALTPTYLSDAEAEAPVAIPTVFRATQGLWVPGSRVLIYRNNLSETYYTDIRNNQMWLYLYGGTPTPIFNLDGYDASVAAGAPDVLGNFEPGIPDTQKLALVLDEKMGEVRFAFDAAPEPFETDVINTNSGACTLPIDAYGSTSRVVPGSEEVFGPDQTPRMGVNPDVATSRRVRYARIPLALMGNPGINQYKMDYDTGEMWFASGTDGLPPSREIVVNYKVHMNDSADIVRADYTTKNLLTITFGMRLFDQLANKMYTTELTNKVRVKNTVR